MNNFKIIIFLFLGIIYLGQGFAQISISKNKIDYANPKEYEIGGITVSGVKYLDANVLKHMSGLEIGEKILIPSEDITKAIEKLWKQGLFSDINISATKFQGDKEEVQEVRERAYRDKHEDPGSADPGGHDLQPRQPVEGTEGPRQDGRRVRGDTQGQKGDGLSPPRHAVEPGRGDPGHPQRPHGRTLQSHHQRDAELLQEPVRHAARPRKRDGQDARDR